MADMDTLPGLALSALPEEYTPAEGPLPGMAEDGIHAGFPSPAQDYMHEGVDLNRVLVRHPTATFYGRVVGDSMMDAGVDEGDILVIDKSLEPKDGDMVVCFVDGEFALKFLSFRDPGRPARDARKAVGSFRILPPKELWLLPANKAYPPIHVTETNDFTVWGVVTHVIKSVWKEH